jgi:glutamyl-tRNA reductase
MRLLEGAGARRLTVVNRSFARGAELAARHAGSVEPWEARALVLAQADVIFACTAAATPIVGRAQLAADVSGPPRGPRLVVDLGVPRNVEPEVAALPGVALWDVDALAGGGGSSRDAEQAEAVAAEWAERYDRWLAARPVAPTIARLRAGAERVRERELARAFARLEGLDARERAVVAELATRLVNKLLHPPLAALSAAPESPALHESAFQLFGLEPRAEDPLRLA